MNRTSFSGLLLASALLLGACNREKATETTAAAEAPTYSADASANPTVDNPNATAETTTPNPNAPVMTFSESSFDFGDIKPGSTVKHTFSFTNTGKSPLLISNAIASCGCTTPNWTKEPVAPGGKGTIDVQFNSTGKTGQQNKEISVQANTEPAITKVTIKANILPDGANGPAAK